MQSAYKKISTSNHMYAFIVNTLLSYSASKTNQRRFAQEVSTLLEFMQSFAGSWGGGMYFMSRTAPEERTETRGGRLLNTTEL